MIKETMYAVTMCTSFISFGIVVSAANAQQVCPMSRIKEVAEARQYFKFVLDKEIAELKSDLDRTTDKATRMAITEEQIKLLKIKASISLSMTKRELLVGGCGDEIN